MTVHDTATAASFDSKALPSRSNAQAGLPFSAPERVLIHCLGASPDSPYKYTPDCDKRQSTRIFCKSSEMMSLTRHPELDSGSPEMLKRVQHDVVLTKPELLPSF